MGWSTFKAPMLFALGFFFYLPLVDGVILSNAGLDISL
jgi:hypothetical protein